MVSNSLLTTSRSWRSCITSRRAFSTRPFASPAARPRLATVIRRSTNGRSSFAFGTVVVRCSYLSRAVAWFRSIEMRCSVTRPSFRCATLCLIVVLRSRFDVLRSLALRTQNDETTNDERLVLRRAGRLVDAHAEAEAHRVQDFLDLVEALAAEILGLEHP